jgi:hypothetical protein
MNKHFVNIKMDREERPDVDKVYMTFVQVKYCILYFYIYKIDVSPLLTF